MHTPLWRYRLAAMWHLWRTKDRDDAARPPTDADLEWRRAVQDMLSTVLLVVVLTIALAVSMRIVWNRVAPPPPPPTTEPAP
jgi:hypothetical protein